MGNDETTLMQMLYRSFTGVNGISAKNLNILYFPPPPVDSPLASLEASEEESEEGHRGKK